MGVPAHIRLFYEKTMHHLHVGFVLPLIVIRQSYAGRQHYRSRF